MFEKLNRSVSAVLGGLSWSSTGLSGQEGSPSLTSQNPAEKKNKVVC